MTMIEYVNAVKRALRDQHGFKQIDGTADEPLFVDAPAGIYPMVIDGKLWYTAVIAPGVFGLGYERLSQAERVMAGDDRAAPHGIRQLNTAEGEVRVYLESDGTSKLASKWERVECADCAERGVASCGVCSAPEYNAALDALESLILAHAAAGVDVEAKAYVEGVNGALEACGNHFG